MATYHTSRISIVVIAMRCALVQFVDDKAEEQIIRKLRDRIGLRIPMV